MVRRRGEEQKSKKKGGKDEFDDDGDEYMCVCSGQMRGRKKSEDNLGFWGKNYENTPLFLFIYFFILNL